MDTFSKPASVIYEDGQYSLVSPGTYVLCAVTGQRIPLTHLRYWSVKRQEPYATAEAAHKRHQECQLQDD